MGVEEELLEASNSLSGTSGTGRVFSALVNRAARQWIHGAFKQQLIIPESAPHAPDSWQPVACEYFISIPISRHVTSDRHSPCLPRASRPTRLKRGLSEPDSRSCAVITIFSPTPSHQPRQRVTNLSTTSSLSAKRQSCMIPTT
jgi:hypothetical protein